MRNKFIKLPVILILLFSLQGFSQTTEKSEHPLLDKYYPQMQSTDKNKTVTTQIKPGPLTKPAPAVTTATIPVMTPSPAVTTTPAPEPAITTTTVPAMTTTPSMTTTTTINTPTTVTPQVPAQNIQARPAPSLYSETRLGSSTRQYDTWEKNSNGAGSVTTSPK